MSSTENKATAHKFVQEIFNEGKELYRTLATNAPVE